MWEVLSEIQNLQTKREKLAQTYFNALSEDKLNIAAIQYRQSLIHFSKVISARTGRKREQYFEKVDMNQIKETFPIWLSKLSTLSKSIPFEENQFDLVIIDEASQCDVSSCLPALQRAKKAVFVGDPKQLRFISFLPKFKEISLQEKYDVDCEYKNHSILDFALENLKSSDQIVMLNEHFRSHPSIINFSNEEFYFKGLNLMKLNPSSHLNSKQYFKQLKGKRSKAGVNEKEVDFILNEIQKVINSEVELPKKAKNTIGVISPFRNQADALTEAIINTFSSGEIRNHKIRCSTPYAFQGQEKNVIFISLSLDDKSHGAAFAYMNKEDVFNVTITRAKHKQVVVHSFNIEALANHHLIKKMHQLEIKEEQKWIKPSEEKDAFSNEVMEALKKLKFKIYPRFQFSSLDVDLLVKKGNQYIGIDLVGYPGEMASQFNLERYSMLNRAGFKTYPLPYSYLKLNQELVMNELRKL